MRIARAVATSVGTALAAAVLTAAPPTTPAAAAAEDERRIVLAALGDSITRGFNACGFYRDCVSRSWSTGSKDSVDSHARRLSEQSALRIAPVNLARTGARSGALAAQAARAVEARAGYVTIEIGANDVCVPAEEQMTSVEDYRENVRAGLDLLRAGAPQAQVLIASIPDLRRLWSIGKGKWYVRQVWNRLDVCPSMLARPNSSDPADVERRERVRARTMEFNEVLAAECAAYGPQCRFDGNAVFRARFTLGQVSKWDFFHPSTDGQRLLAEITWQAGFVRPDFAASASRPGA